MSGLSTRGYLSMQSRWGDVYIGDVVTSKGRSGWGQPPITGKLLRIERKGICVVKTKDGERKRAIFNLRKDA
jgi:hypothetical protein